DAAGRASVANRQVSRYLYVAPGLDRTAVFSSDALEATTERHKIVLPVNGLRSGDPLQMLEGDRDVAGVVIALDRGIPGRAQLRLAARALRSRRRAWMYWPDEQTVKCVDRERLKSFKRHRLGVIALDKARPIHRLVHLYRDGLTARHDAVLSTLGR